MGSFQFNNVPAILFGRGQLSGVAEWARQLGRAPAVIFNGGALGSGGAVDNLVSQLRDSGIRPHFVRHRGEPTIDDVDGAVGSAKQHGCDCVIGLGGGSAIDAAKAVAGLLTNGGVATDYMEVVGKGQKIVKHAAPWIAIPTTAGTGAEATRNAVIGHPEKKFKASIRSELLLPRVALIDPELGVDVPPAVTASSGMDALCQLIESYTSTGANPMTDALAIKGIALASRSLLRVYENGHDLDAREDMAMAALLSGITLTNAGLGAVHGFAAPLGANFPILHGTICAALLTPVVAANVSALRGVSNEHPTLGRYADIGRSLKGHAAMSASDAIDGVGRFLADLLMRLHIPTLGSFGLTESAIPEMVALARKSSSMRFNPVVLSDHALSDILRSAL